MRIQRAVLLSLLAVFVFSGCLGKFYQYQKHPVQASRSGTVSIPELEDRVEVYFDHYGVPQVFTDNEHDLFFAIGWLQAQDRLFEMVLIRAMSEGRLTELLGDLPVALSLGGQKFKPLDYDVHQRVWGLKYLGEVMEAMVKRYDPEAYNQLKAYIDGVNTYIRTHQDSLPMELQVLNLKPEEFRGADVYSLGLFMGTMLGANYYEELFRYSVMRDYGWDMVWKLAPIQTELGPNIVPTDLLQNKLKEPVKDLLEGTPRARDLELSSKAALALLRLEKQVQEAAGFVMPVASNNWAATGKATTDGNAILCNDPHLAHMQPSMFYLMRVKGAGFDTYGVAFPGEPYLVLGHAPKLAWALTTARADVEDLYIEKVNPANPGQYLFKGEWRDFTVREERIKIRIGFTSKFKYKTIRIRQSLHGPVLNATLPLPKDTPPLALRWTGWDLSRDLRVFEALVQSKDPGEFMSRFEKLNAEKPARLMSFSATYNALMKGDKIEDFEKGVEHMSVPSQNWLVADASGHIEYLPGALVPIRAKGRGLVPVPGWTGDYEWTGFIPLFELPRLKDPARGWIATANNRVVDMQWYPYTFGSNYSFGWRAMRIEELLEKLKPLDVEKMARIQNDVYSKEGEMFAPLIVNAVAKKGGGDARLQAAVQYLKDWDYETNTDSVAASIYYATAAAFYENVLKDEFPPDFYQAFLANRLFMVILQTWIANRGSEFFDDKTTREKVEDMDDMWVSSLEDSCEWLGKKLGKDMAAWQWGKIHTITFAHPLGLGPLKALNHGPFPHIGADQTVRNASFSHNPKNPFTTSEGPVLRHIINMGKPDEALMVIDGSESGNYLDPHYADMHKLWLNSQYNEAVMDEAAVKENAKSALILEP